jgi:hypothetical protein
MEVGSSSSWLDIITINNASFAIHWEVMCGCVGASEAIDKDGRWQSVTHHVGTVRCARA